MPFWGISRPPVAASLAWEACRIDPEAGAERLQAMRRLDFGRLEDGKIGENRVLVVLRRVDHQPGEDVGARMKEVSS